MLVVKRKIFATVTLMACRRCLTLAWGVALARVAGISTGEALAPTTHKYNGLQLACEQAARANDKEAYAEALHIVRSCLAKVSPDGITNERVASARLLLHGATALGHLGRYADAEQWARTGQALVDSADVDVAVQRWHAARAVLVQDWGAVGRAAEIGLAKNPDAYPELFHYLALAQQMRGDHEKAMDTWLLGLHGMPVERVPEYLDMAMCFWKPMSDSHIVRLHAALGACVRSVTARSAPGLARVMRERIKLQVLYPELCRPERAQTMLAQSTWWPEHALAWQEEWRPLTNAYVDVDMTSMRSNTWETQLTRALAMVRRAHARAEMDCARSILDNVIEHTPQCSGMTVRVEGWSVAALAHALRAGVEAKCSLSTEATRHRADAAAAYVLEKAIPGAQYGAVEYLFQVYMWRWMRAAMRQDKRGTQEAYEAMTALFPASAVLESLKITEGLLREDNPALAVTNMLMMATNPAGTFMTVPAWLGMARACEACARRAQGRTADSWRAARVDVLLTALERCAQYELPSATPVSSTRPRRLSEDPFYTEVTAGLKAGGGLPQHHERLARFLHWYGATIPALDEQVALLQDIMAARQRAARTTRAVSVPLLVIADTAGWHVPTRPWIWCDLDNVWHPMQAATPPRYWQATYTVPPGQDLVRFAIRKTAAAEPPCDASYVRITNQTADRLIITNLVERDHDVVVALECDARGKQLASHACIVGSVPALGAWDVQRRAVMRDDGQSYGDRVAGDGVFRYTFTAPPEVTEVSYVFLDGGEAGEWGVGTPRRVRHAVIPSACGSTAVLYHVFGEEIR